MAVFQSLCIQSAFIASLVLLQFLSDVHIFKSAKVVVYLKTKIIIKLMWKNINSYFKTDVLRYGGQNLALTFLKIMLLLATVSNQIGC